MNEEENDGVNNEVVDQIKEETAEIPEEFVDPNKGKVSLLADKIKDMTHRELFDRFNHITRAQAVREYLATKEDILLKIEVRLTGEEILHRMSIMKSMTI